VGIFYGHIFPRQTNRTDTGLGDCLSAILGRISSSSSVQWGLEVELKSVWIYALGGFGGRMERGIRPESAKTCVDAIDRYLQRRYA
jgi:hypothetical protein